MTIDELEESFQQMEPTNFDNIAYAEGNDEISIGLTYKADEFNPFANAADGMDGLGMVLVKKSSKRQGHSFADALNRINIIL